MKVMYQRNGNPTLLTLEQSFTNAEPGAIIKVMPYCRYCVALSQGDATISPPYSTPLPNRTWIHDMETNGLPSSVICTQYGALGCTRT